MQIRLVSYVPFGARQGVLPDALESNLVTPLGELPTVQVHYHRSGVNALELDGLTELAVERWAGTGWVEPPQCRFLSMTGGFDHLEDTPTRKYAFVGVGWMLRRAKVWEAGALPVDADGKVQFLSASAGTIMATLIQNAQTRGWGAGLSIDFDANTDSDGQAWAKIITIAYDLELDLEAILTNLYQQGVCDYRWEGRTLRIFNPDTAMGRDLTTGANPLRLVVADGQTSAPEDWTNEDLLTNALVIGEDGQSWTFENGSSSPLGRLERVITQGGVSDEGTASLLADQELLKGSQTRISYTREFVITGESAVWPFRDYLPGDWVSAQRGTGFERLRTHSVSLTVTADGVKGHAVLGDRLEDLLTKLAKRTKGITGGASAGGSGARPAPEGPDTRSPSAPDGLLAASTAYLDKDGTVQGAVQLDWAHDGLATDGTAIGVDRYQVYFRENVVGAVWAHLTSTQQTDVSHSPLPVGTPQEPAEFAFKVRAIADSGRASAFSGQYVAVMEQDTTPPAEPSALVTGERLGVLNVSWDGLGSAGEEMPLDYRRTLFEVGTSATGPWAALGELRAAGTLYYDGAPAGQTRWFRARAEDRSGNASPWTASVSALATQVVDDPSVDAELTRIDDDLGGVITQAASLDARLGTAETEITTSEERLDVAESDVNDAFGRLLAKNGSFEYEGQGGPTTASYWTATEGQFDREAHAEAVGSYLMRADAAAASGSRATLVYDRRIPYISGSIYKFSLRVKKVAAGSTSSAALLQARLRLFYSDGSSAWESSETLVKGSDLPLDEWVTLETTIKANPLIPAHEASFDIRANDGTGELLIDDVRITEESGAIAGLTAEAAEKIAEEAIGKATNIISNSGFERDTEGWDMTMLVATSEANAYKGQKYVLAFANTAVYALSHSFTLIEEGTVLDYGAWVLQNSAGTATARIALRLNSGSGSRDAHEISGFPQSGPDYVKYSGRYTVTEQDILDGYNEATVFIEVISGSPVSFQLDEVHLKDVTEVVAAQETADNAVQSAAAAQVAADAAKAAADEAAKNAASIVINPGFERDHDGWSSGGTIGPISTQTSKTGSKSMFFGTSNESYTDVHIQLEEGTVVEYGGWVYQDHASNSTGGFRLHVQNGAGSWLNVVPENIAPTGGEWVKKTYRYTAGTDRVAARLRIATGGNPYSFFVDDVFMRDVTELAALEQAASDAAQAAADAQAAAGSAQSTADLALTSANGKNTVHRELTAPSGVGQTEGDIWWQFRDSSWTEVMGEWTWDGTNWQAQKQGHETIASVDIGTLTVIGQSTLADVVAQRIAADSGQFIELGVGQLTAVTGTFTEGVLERLYADMAAFRKITANMIAVGDFTSVVPAAVGSDGVPRSWASGFTVDDVDTPGAGIEYTLHRYKGSGSYSPVAEYFDLEDEQEYLWEIWLKADVPDSKIYMEVRDDAGNHLGGWANVPGTNSATFSSGYPVGALTVPTVWTKFTSKTKAPAGGARVRLSTIYFNHTSGTEQNAQVSMTPPLMRRRNAGQFIVDGTVVGRHVASESISTDKLAANAVTAAKADIGSLEAEIVRSDVFQGKSFTGGEFVGGVFRTPYIPTGNQWDDDQWVELNSDGLFVFHSNNGQPAQRFALDAATGNIYMKDAELDAGLIQGAEIRSEHDGGGSGGVIIKPGGLYGYDSSGNRMFTIASGNGFALADKRMVVGDVALKKIIITSPNDGSNRAAVWWSETTDGSVGGSETAGIYIEDSTNTVQPLEMRGKGGGGVIIRQGLTVYSGLVSDARLQVKDTPSTSLGANAHISVGGSIPGTIYLSSSASRYKLDQQVMDLPDELLDIPVKDWIDRAQHEEWERLADLGVRDEGQQAVFEKALRRIPGMVAEDVEAVDFRFAIYGEDGQVEGLAYERLANARTAVLKRQVDELREQLAAAVDRIAALEAAQAG